MNDKVINQYVLRCLLSAEWHGENLLPVGLAHRDFSSYDIRVPIGTARSPIIRHVMTDLHCASLPPLPGLADREGESSPVVMDHPHGILSAHPGL